MRKEGSRKNHLNPSKHINQAEESINQQKEKRKTYKRIEYKMRTIYHTKDEQIIGFTKINLINIKT